MKKQIVFKTISRFTAAPAGSSSTPVRDSWRVILECWTLPVTCVCIGLLHLNGFHFLIHLKNKTKLLLLFITHNLDFSIIFPDNLSVINHGAPKLTDPTKVTILQKFHYQHMQIPEVAMV